MPRKVKAPPTLKWIVQTVSPDVLQTTLQALTDDRYRIVTDMCQPLGMSMLIVAYRNESRAIAASEPCGDKLGKRVCVLAKGHDGAHLGVASADGTVDEGWIR